MGTYVCSRATYVCTDSVAAVATLDEQADPNPSADSATEGAALFEQVNPEAVSAASRRSLKDIGFQEYKTGKFAGKKDPTCLSSIACPFDIKRSRPSLLAA
jgi:hypothetical protein